MGSSVFTNLGHEMSKAGIRPNGVVHVGAHKGEEVGVYDALHFRRVVLFEPNPSPEIQETLQGILTKCALTEVHKVAIAPQEAAKVLYLTKKSQCATLIPSPRVKQRAIVRTMPLSAFDLSGCNVLVVDAQGSELDVLKSGPLDQFEMLIIELDFSGRYPVNPLALDDHLAEAGFDMVETYEHDQDKRVMDGVFVRRQNGQVLSSCPPAG